MQMSGKRILDLLDKPYSYIIFQYMFDYTKSQVFLNKNRELTYEEYLRFEEIQEKLKEGLPLQYAIGKWNFYGRDFIVNENVLIPRPETELLIDEILKLDLKDKKILDIGTGSGAIAITISLETKQEVYALDISSEALEVARKNSKLFKSKVNFMKSDLFNDISKDLKFDIIVSNPPYLTEKEYENVDSLLYHEPKIALVGGQKGYEIYEIIIKEAKNKLNENGMLFFEIGYQQADILKILLEENGYEDVRVLKDYGNKDRVVIAKIVS